MQPIVNYDSIHSFCAQLINNYSSFYFVHRLIFELMYYAKLARNRRVIGLNVSRKDYKAQMIERFMSEPK